MHMRLGELTYLDEGKQEAHSKIGQPVDGAGDHEGSWAVRLLKQLSGQDEGDSTCWRGQKTRSIRVAVSQKHSETESNTKRSP